LYITSTRLGYPLNGKAAVLADHTALGLFGYWHDNVVCLSVCLSVCDAVHCG